MRRGIVGSAGTHVLDLRQCNVALATPKRLLPKEVPVKILLPVDGSESAVRATRKLIDTLGWYREAPAIELCTVHPPIPRVPNMGAFVSHEMVQKYYADE